LTYGFLFLGFLIANLLGYGGGPASIPLMQNEIVNHYGWLSNDEFINVLAIGNALPGPIATKIAAYTGYAAAGWIGVIVALLATIVPSAVAVIALLKLLHKYRQSAVVKGMTLLVQPVIAMLMAVLTYQIAGDSILSIGWLQFALIAFVAFVAMQKFKVHPALVIVAAILYGAIFLS